MADVQAQESELPPGEVPESVELAAREREQFPTHSPVEAMTDRELAVAWRTARALAASGMFKDARQAEQAFAKVLMGRDLGLSPTQAMTQIHLIEGRPELSANFHAIKLRESPEYDYRVLTLTNEECAIEFGRGQAPGKGDDGEWLPWRDSLGVSEFTQADAEQAKLSKRSRERSQDGEGRIEGTGMYEKYPRNMLFSRAMSNGVAWYVPEVMGALRVYVPGEVAAEADTSGELRKAGDAPAVEDTFDWGIVSEGVRDRLRGAVERANELRAGAWPPAKCEMTFAGRSEKMLNALAERIERENDPDGPVSDADVVEDDDEKQSQERRAEAEAHGPPSAVDEEAQRRVDALRLREAALSERLPTAQSDREEEELSAELEKVQGELRTLVGEAAGQESLDVDGGEQ